MKGIVTVFFALAATMVAAPLLLGSASAADVSRTLIGESFAWHFGSTSGNNETSVNTVDTLRLTIRNDDATLHTFTSEHFGIDQNIGAGQTIFVNITMDASDAGRWQFHCTPHSSGSGENWAGMTGYITVVAATPPRTPGFEALAVFGAALAAFAIVAAIQSRRS